MAKVDCNMSTIQEKDILMVALKIYVVRKMIWYQKKTK